MIYFDAAQKIQQIRLYWDQGSLLKQVDVIGARAKNWPIRDGKDQARLIHSSTTAVTSMAGTAKPSSQSSTEQTENSGKTKPRAQSKNVTRDPHASLSLFTPREEAEDSGPAAVAPRAPAFAKPPPRDYHDLFVGPESDASPQSKPIAVSPKKGNSGVRAPKAMSAKPPPRDYHELFVGEDSDNSPVAKGRAPSPKKENMIPAAIAPKGGSGKNYQPSRLFESDETMAASLSTPNQSNDQYIKPHPKKYNHFDFGEPDDTPQPSPVRPKTKHQNNWDFSDFATPEPTKKKGRNQDVRHFGWEDDEPVMDSPAKHPAVAKVRPDSKANFEFQDDGTPAGDRRPAGHPRGAGNVRAGVDMYQNNVMDENEQTPGPDRKQPLSTVTNLKDRRKDFDPHFDITDDAMPAHDNKQSVPEARAKVVGQMGAQWEAADSSPGLQRKEAPSNPVSGDKENYSNGGTDKHIGIKSGGDGMGGKKGAGRSWGFGDDSDGEGEGGRNAGGFRASKAQQAPKDSGFWDF